MWTKKLTCRGNLRTKRLTLAYSKIIIWMTKKVKQRYHSEVMATIMTIEIIPWKSLLSSTLPKCRIRINRSKWIMLATRCLSTVICWMSWRKLIWPGFSNLMRWSWTCSKGRYHFRKKEVNLMFIKRFTFRINTRGKSRVKKWTKSSSKSFWIARIYRHRLTVFSQKLRRKRKG